jgi:hypothetical protein
MKKRPSRAANRPSQTPQTDPRFLQVIEAFNGNPEVTRDIGKGFGSGALKVSGRIFAMISAKGDFVLKLPRERVAGLCASGLGKPFSTGPGRTMKEWLVVTAPAAPWVDLAKEACQFTAERNR